LSARRRLHPKEFDVQEISRVIHVAPLSKKKERSAACCRILPELGPKSSKPIRLICDLLQMVFKHPLKGLREVFKCKLQQIPPMEKWFSNIYGIP